jgi:hypothetical protein
MIYSEMKKTIEQVGNDPRCDVHQTVLGIRDGKEGWFHLYCPGGIACDDDGSLFSVIVSQSFAQIVCNSNISCFFPVETLDGMLLSAQEISPFNDKNDFPLYVACPA